MGRLIEESRVVEILQQTWLSGTIAYRFIDDIKRRIRIEVPTVEAIPKEQYENRLKADLKAILEDLRLKFEEYEPKWVENDEQAVASCRTWEDLDGIIQQKIDAMRKINHE